MYYNWSRKFFPIFLKSLKKSKYYIKNQLNAVLDKKEKKKVIWLKTNHVKLEIRKRIIKILYFVLSTSGEFRNLDY